jgi:hypothetical protein
MVAPYGYGTLDVGVKLSTPDVSDGFVIFTILNISNWITAPMQEQKHLSFATLCPADMCPDGGYPSQPDGRGGHTTVSGKFQGFRGKSCATTY